MENDNLFQLKFMGNLRNARISHCYTQRRHGSELSSSSKTRVFVSGFGSSKKFETQTKVREPKILIFLKKYQFLDFLKVFF